MIKVGDIYQKVGSRWSSDREALVVIIEVSDLYVKYRYTDNPDDAHGLSGKWPFKDFDEHFERVSYD